MSDSLLTILAIAIFVYAVFGEYITAAHLKLFFGILFLLGIAVIGCILYAIRWDVVLLLLLQKLVCPILVIIILFALYRRFRRY